jgi:D-aminopeptidase
MRSMRARDLGIVIGQLPTGRLNAITDVAGVRVGHRTLIRGDAVRTGVTVILPHEGDPVSEPVFAGCHTLNGYGEMTGLEWVRESGLLTAPIALTNTNSVGVVRDALVQVSVQRQADGQRGGPTWLPVVAETWDGYLNDIDGQHVTADDLVAALDAAENGPVAEGNVGGGTGIKAFGFKAGIGTASRMIDAGDRAYTVGALVQANFGRRPRLTIDGVPVGREIPLTEIAGPDPAAEGGSVVVILATDAPLLPDQCRRLAQRAALGIARMGGAGENDSGDFFLAFATGNRGLAGEEQTEPVIQAIRMLNSEHIDPFFWAAVDATEEAVINALVAAETMTGNGVTFHALPADRLLEVMARYGRGHGA